MEKWLNFDRLNSHFGLVTVRRPQGELDQSINERIEASRRYALIRKKGEQVFNGLWDRTLLPESSFNRHDGRRSDV